MAHVRIGNRRHEITTAGLVGRVNGNYTNAEGESFLLALAKLMKEFRINKIDVAWSVAWNGKDEQDGTDHDSGGGEA